MNSSPSTNPAASHAPPTASSTASSANFTEAASSSSFLAAEGSAKKVRKPYTITKSRESWTEEEHDKFLEALELFDRDWKKIEDFVGSKTVIQIRSHAQKYFLKVQKSGTLAHVPPPRPKRKAAHPYPQKASKNAQASTPSPWDDASALMNTGSNRVVSPQNELATLGGAEAEIGSKGLTNACGSSTPGMGRTLSGSDVLIQGVPDFAEVYNFIGNVFDPDIKGHEKKLKEMDPLNFETVLLLMRNLTVNLSNPDFDPVKNVLSSYNMSSKLVGGSMVKTRDVSSSP